MSKKEKPKSGLRAVTLSELPIDPLYTDNDPKPSSLRELGSPGTYPYTRGIYESMYRGKLWTMRQYAGFGSAKEANKRFRFLLEQGTTGLSVAFDLPTQMGRDPDHPLAKGEVGKVGVSVASVRDMELLLDSIPLEKVSISMTINATAAILLAFLLVVAERRKISWKKLQGTIQNDILKEYIARGTYIYPPNDGMRIVTDVFAFASKEVPLWNTISISGYHIREAGSTAIEEVAFTLANGITYVDAAIRSGLEVDSFAPRIAFFFNCHNDFFEEIAKFRAARRLWARIMKDRFNAKDPRSQMLRFHTQTAGSSLTAQQPLNNIARTTIQALAAVLGGTQSLHTNAFDEALALPTEESATVALRSQQILAYESGVTNTVDPLGGSYFVEYLTDKIEEEARKKIEAIDTAGGMVRAIEEGLPMDDIERSAYRCQQRLECGELTVVGVNRYTTEEERTTNLHQGDLRAEGRQRRGIQNVRKGRNGLLATKALAKISEVARSKGNLIPCIVDAARKEATLGEISDALRGVFGEYKPRRGA